MSIRFAVSRLLAAKRHLAEHERYRWWPLYSACLATFIYATHFFPRNWMVYVDAWVAHPWLLDFDKACVTAAQIICVVLGIAGLVRSNWFVRGLGLYGAYMGYTHFYGGYNPFSGLWVEFTWYTFDIPGTWIHGYAGEGTELASILWCVYLGVVWIVIRPWAKLGFAHLQILEQKMIRRWPAMNRFAKPVM